MKSGDFLTLLLFATIFTNFANSLVPENDAADYVFVLCTEVCTCLQISRHGNRGASWNYPNDPYPLDNLEYWPYGVDRLTPVSAYIIYCVINIWEIYDSFDSFIKHKCFC